MGRITAQEALARISSDGRRKSKGAAPSQVRDCGGVYVFSNGLVAPADDELPPVLGYTDGETGGSIPPSMLNWLEGYNLEVSVLQGMSLPIEEASSKAKAKAAPRESIPALIKARWAQTAPYNQNIIVGGKKCVAGCCAIAVAQILYYWGVQGRNGRTYRRGCMATPGYKTMTNGDEVAALPPVTSFAYDTMTATKPTSKASKASVAQLVEYVGKAMQSDYKPSSTGAMSTLIAPALKDYLRMGSTVRFIQSSKVGTKAFEQLIYDEICAGRPVYMDGAISAKSTAGHAFVCDGYDSANDLYHFNWGWGGSYNGWFAMSALTPYNRNYSFRKEAVIGIDPTTNVPGDLNGDGSISVTDVMQAVRLRNSGGYDERADVNYDGKVDKEDIDRMRDMVLGK